MVQLQWTSYHNNLQQKKNVAYTPNGAASAPDYQSKATEDAII